MKLPRSMAIRGAIWKIKECSNPKVDGQTVEGSCCANTRTIEVQQHANDLKKAEIFLHEYLHAVWAESGIDDENPPEFLEHWAIISITKDMINNRKVFNEFFKAIAQKKHN